MDESRIQQVLQIEKEAREIYEAAIREAEQLPLAADREGQALIEKARADAEQEARELIATAQTEEDSARHLADAGDKASRSKGLAMSHMERAVGYVLDRVAGRE